MKDGDKLDEFDDECPRHKTPLRKTYTFGSTMTAEADVHTFLGCRCAVAECHDPIGTYGPSLHYYESYNNATGAANLHKMMCGAKLR